MKTVHIILHLALIVLGTAVSMIAIPVSTVLIGGSETVALLLFWLVLSGGGIAFMHQVTRVVPE